MNTYLAPRPYQALGLGGIPVRSVPPVRRCRGQPSVGLPLCVWGGWVLHPAILPRPGRIGSRMAPARRSGSPPGQRVWLPGRLLHRCLGPRIVQYDIGPVFDRSLLKYPEYPVSATYLGVLEQGGELGGVVTFLFRLAFVYGAGSSAVRIA